MGVRGSLLPVASVMLLILGGCSPPVETAGPVEIPVYVIRPQLNTNTHSRTYTGVIRPRYEAELAFRVPGKILARLVEVGDRIQAGQVVARLDVTDYKLAAEAAASELAAARANARRAAADAERVAQLRGTSAISKQEWDAAKATADATAETVAMAERNLELANNRMAYCELRADHDGVVMSLAAEAGQVVTEGQAVVRVARTGEKEAVIGVPEHQLSELRECKACVRLWSQGDREYTAELREVSPTADPQSRTYEARFRIPANGESIELGMTATVVLSRPQEVPTFTLPPTAILGQQSSAQVWVVDPKSSQLTLMPVKVQEFRSDAVVVQGLTGDELVVRAGGHKLDAGLRVRIREEAQ